MSQKIFIALCLFDVIQSIVHLLPSIVYRWPLFVSLLVHAISSFKQVFTNLAAQKMFLSYPFVFLFCKISIKPSFLWHSRDCVIIWISLTFLRSGALHWLSDWPKNFLQSEALIRAHWLPDPAKTSCDQELFIDSLIGRKTFCNRKLLSELIDSLIQQKLLAIRSSYENSLIPSSTNKLLAIRSSY